jgi:large subunit ribosomal protein L22
MTIQISITVWTVICFILLMLILHNWLFKPVLQMMDRRRERIEKAAARKENADKRPHATAKYVRVAPRKAKIVVDLIRGKQVDEALAILMYTPKAAAPVVEKLLNSAIANAEYKEMDRSTLYVAEVYANQGPTLKRYWARSHGRADMIKKHTSHITIVLDQK